MCKKNTFHQLAATNPFAHWTAMKKLRLTQAVNRKIKTQLLSVRNKAIKYLNV
jgi:hypothetical protein